MPRARLRGSRVTHTEAVRAGAGRGGHASWHPPLSPPRVCVPPSPVLWSSLFFAQTRLWEDRTQWHRSSWHALAPSDAAQATAPTKSDIGCGFVQDVSQSQRLRGAAAASAQRLPLRCHGTCHPRPTSPPTPRSFAQPISFRFKCGPEWHGGGLSCAAVTVSGAEECECDAYVCGIAGDCGKPCRQRRVSGAGVERVSSGTFALPSS
eukprot:1203650-Rhodomonas_salina.2